MSKALSTILTDDQVLIDLHAIDRWEVIDELIDNLVRTGKLKPRYRDAAIAAVKKRESAMSTGIGFGIAYPHATTGIVHEVIGVLGRSSNGVSFDALDGKPVTIVILFLVPPWYLCEHLHTLGKLTRLLHEADFRLALESASDATAIFELFRGREGIPANGSRKPVGKRGEAI